MRNSGPLCDTIRKTILTTTSIACKQFSRVIVDTTFRFREILRINHVLMDQIHNIANNSIDVLNLVLFYLLLYYLLYVIYTIYVLYYHISLFYLF